MTMGPPGGESRRLLVNGERLTEQVTRASGGGPKFEPQTFAEAQELLSPQIQSLLRESAEIPSGYRAERVVFEARVLPNYLANYNFPAQLLDQTGVTALGSRRAEAPYRTKTGDKGPRPTKSLLLAGDEMQLQQFERLLEGQGSGRSERSAAEQFVQFDQIGLSHPSILQAEVDPDETGELLAFEAVLHPDPVESTSSVRVPASQQTRDLFAQVVEGLSGDIELDFVSEVGGLTFLPMRLTRTAERALRQFNPLRALRPMPILRPLRSATQPASTTTLAPPSVPANDGAPVVHVFDGGMDPNGLVFAGSTTSADLVAEQIRPNDKRHGEAVVATVLYGLIDPTTPLPTPVAHVKHYRVTPVSSDESIALPQMLRSIRNTLKGTEGALVNLSLGPSGPIEDDEPHEWTALLDTIAYEQKTMFITAPGNDGDKDEALQRNRIQAPADMVNGLSVGACDVAAPLKPWKRTSFSPVGPGRKGAIVQPALVAFGGAIGQLFGRLDANGVLTQDDWGTSYATPQVTHALAGLRSELGDRGTAPTLRAFAIHGAERRPDDPLLRELGYGRALGSFAQLLSCESHRVTVLYQGTVARDEIRAFYLPVPDNLQKGNVELHCTLAYTSPTDPTEAPEYTKAALDRTFRPHAQKFRLTPPSEIEGSPRTLHLVDDRADIDQLLQDGWSFGDNPMSGAIPSTVGPEHLTREQGRWETIWDAKRRVRAASLYRPRLDLSHITRAAGQLTRGSDEIDFSLVVTVRGPTDYPLYQEVTQQFAVLDALPVPGVEVSLDT